MGCAVSTIKDFEDENVKKAIEMDIKETIKNCTAFPTFLISRWYSREFFVDQYTLVKIIKQLTTEPFVISKNNEQYWNVSFVQ